MQVLILPYIENFDLAEKHFEDIHFDKTYFKNIRFIFDEDGPRVLFKDKDCKYYDLVWLSSYWGTRDLAYSLQLYLDSHKVKHTPAEKSGSKVVDHMNFSLNGIRSPKTYFVNRPNPEANIEEIEEICGYPLLQKDIKGCRGRNTRLIRSRKELLSAAKDIPQNIKVMYQEFIPNEYDWGVLVSKGKVVAAEKSFPKKGEFRNNACNGAKEVFVDVEECPENVRNMAQKAAKTLNLDWCRSDIVINKNTGNPYMLEVNRYPGITKGTDEVKAVIDFVGKLTS